MPQTLTIGNRAWLSRTLAALMTFFVLSTTMVQADILRTATGAKDPLCHTVDEAPPAAGATAPTGCTNKDEGIWSVVDKLLTPALWIVVALAPLAMAWGGGMLMFGGKNGPQIMAGAVVAVVLVASTKGIAL
jgi:hypothetical protein